MKTETTLIETEDPCLKLALQSDTIIMGLYEVLFGWRIRAGYLSNKMEYEVDWCCGDNPLMIMILHKALAQHIKRTNSLKGLPRVSEVKPYYNDPKFLKKLDKTLDHGISGPPFSKVIKTLKPEE